MRSLPGPAFCTSPHAWPSSTRTSSEAFRASSWSTSSASGCHRSAIDGSPTAPLLGCYRAGARLHGLRQRGLPRGHRVGASQPGSRRSITGSVALPVDALSWSCRKRSGASSRRCSTTSSASRRTRALVAFLGPIEAFRRAQIDSAATFNFTPYLLTAVLFLLLTVPMLTPRRLAGRARPAAPDGGRPMSTTLQRHGSDASGRRLGQGGSARRRACEVLR